MRPAYRVTSASHERERTAARTQTVARAPGASPMHESRAELPPRRTGRNVSGREADDSGMEADRCVPELVDYWANQFTSGHFLPGDVTMADSITIRRLTIATVLRLTLLGAVYSLVPLFILMGALTFFGYSPPFEFVWNGEPLTGLPALLVSPFMGLFFAALSGLSMGVCVFAGLWMYSLFRTVDISYLPSEPASSKPDVC